MSDLQSNGGVHRSDPESTQGASSARRVHGAIVVLLCIGLVLVAYVWLVSVGSWTHWPSLTHTYDQLASAFLHGHLALELEPDPALLAVANPYDPAARKGAPFPLDASLYRGKFYLYFGPVPALILAVAKLIAQAEIGDEYLVFAFISGLFVVQSLFALKIWRRFFQDVPLLSLGAGLLVLGLAAPSGWLLSTPNVYSAAVMGGAFFFMAGLYSAFRALDATSIHRGGLVLAGVFWAAAVGSRITQAVPVILLALLVSGEILARQRKAGALAPSLRALLALILPLALGAAALGWYNWARFGSVLESGISYQLSGGFQEHRAELFSPLYIVQNLCNYLFAPARLGYAFPYFKPIPGFRESVIPSIPLPKIYWSSPMAGLMCTAPFVIFSSLNAIHAVQMLRRGSGSDPDQRSLAWITTTLWTAFLSSFGVFLIFFWSAERYLGDFVPPLFLLSVMGFWQLGRILTRGLPRRFLYLLLGIGLAGITILVSNLLAMAFNADGFRALNPVLWRQLGNIFRP